MWGAEWPHKKTLKYYFNILKTEAAQTKTFYGTNQHKRSTDKQDHFFREFERFGACGGLSDVIAYISMSNIFKTEATQTKILTAQTSTNEAQTIEPVLGEFLSMWGGWWRHRL